MIGQKLEQYEIREQIGRGAMGTVYRAYDAALSREVAVKVLSPLAAPGPAQVQRFYQEARAAAGLGHPNVVTIYDIGEHGDLPYFVMELLEGRSAGEALETEGRMPWRQALEVVRQVCLALEAAHEKGILHRDIKPDNVWLHGDGRVKVLDFGIARFSTAQTLTQAGETMGTPEYMAPEQIMGDALDGRTDLYALGVLTYALLTGEPPFTGPNPITVIYRQMEEAPAPPGRVVQDLPVAVERVVLRCMEKDPGRRYASVAALRDEVEALLEGREVGAGGETAAPQEEEEEDEVRFESRLVGRAQELKTLEAALRKLEEGAGGVALVGGEAGIGKTRLATEALEAAGKRGIGVLHGVCMPGEGVEPYLPFVEALVQGIEAGSEAERAEALAYVRSETPELAALSGRLGVRPAGENADPEAAVAVSRERLFEAVSQLLLFLARKRPLAVLLDDLHWADSGSLQLLHYLSRNAQKHPLLFVGTYRTEDLLPDAAGGPHRLVNTMQQMSREGLFQKVELAGLRSPDLGLLVRQIFRRARFSEGFYESLSRETGGNPFFAIETLRMLWEDGVIYRRRGGWRARQELTQGDIPDRVYQVVVRRVDRLTEAQRELLQAAAVGGERFSSEALAFVSGENRIRVLKTLNRLARVHQLVVSERSGFAFSHAKIHEVLYGEIVPELRRTYHQAYGEYLEGRAQEGGEEAVTDLALHFFYGGDFRRALPYLVRAGERASQRFAYREAHGFYARALEALAGGAEGCEREVRYRLGLACLRLGDVPGARAQLEQAGRFAEAEADAGLLARVDRWTGRIHFRAGEYDGAVERYRRSAQQFRKAGDGKAMVDVLVEAANIPFEQGDWKRVEAYYSRALRAAREAKDGQQLGTIYMNSGIMASARGNPDRALELYERSRVLFEKLGDGQSLSKLWLNVGWTQAGRKRWGEAREAYEHALRFIRETRNTYEEARCSLNMAEVLFEMGDLKESKRRCLQALEVFEKVAYRAGLAEVFKTLGQVAGVERRWAESRSYFEKSISMYEAGNRALFAGRANREYARMLKEAEDLDAAKAAVERAMEWFRKADSKADLEEAEALKKEVEAMAYLAGAEPSYDTE